MKFPGFVYKSPGTHQGRGGTYNYKLVKSTEELLEIINDGWFTCVDDAIAGTHAETTKEEFEAMLYNLAKDGIEEPEEPEEDIYRPPTRQEMEVKAKELGIAFNSRTKDETLLEKIGELESNEG